MAAERPVSSRTVYQGKVLTLKRDTVIGADGKEHQRDVVERPPAVVILPVLPDGKLVLIRQYRHAVGEEILEAPAGLCNPGETGDEAARRELREETGYRAGQVRLMLHLYSSPGFTNETLAVYVAQELEPGEPERDPGESMQLEVIDPDDVSQSIASGRIKDGHTIIALLGWTGRRVPLG